MNNLFRSYLVTLCSLACVFFCISIFLIGNTPQATAEQIAGYNASIEAVGIQPNLDPGSNVIPVLRDAYNASIAILSTEGRVICSGTIIQNEPGRPIVILTAWHCVEDIYPYPVMVGLLYNGQVIPTIVQKKQEAWDLALLTGITNMTAPGPRATLAPNPPKLGETTWMIGNPRGIIGNITQGVISNILQVDDDLWYYRIDAAIFYGNSGGGMFDKSGKLIGVAKAVEIFRVPGGGEAMVPGGGVCVSLYNIKVFIES